MLISETKTDDMTRICLTASEKGFHSQRMIEAIMCIMVRIVRLMTITMIGRSLVLDCFQSLDFKPQSWNLSLNINVNLGFSILVTTHRVSLVLYPLFGVLETRVLV